MLQDYYSILEVKPDASEIEIKLAYRKKIRLYHPDQNKRKDAERITKQINEAYSILKDPVKKANYDMQYGIFNDTNYNEMNPFTTQVYTNTASTVNVNINTATGRFRVENPDGTFYEVEWH